MMMKNADHLMRLRRVFTQVIGIVVIALALYASVQVTQPDFVKLVIAAPKARQVLRELLAPDLFTRESEVMTVGVALPVPCDSAPEDQKAITGPRLEVAPGCAAERETVLVRGRELGKGVPVALRWRLPDGNTLGIQRLVTDAKGNFEVRVQVRPIVATKGGQPARIEAEVTLPGGRLAPSQALRDVIDAMFVTVFMALLATTLGTFLAVPLSFLAASNITRRGRLGALVYYLVRTFLNLIRSYEPLVMATIFALIVGFGSPFAGILALVVVTTASLGKMFSESIESIDTGPIEAISATGANRAQVIMYGVVPQILPDFLSFTIYHWDINVRISTIIGFVGGGGIGDYLSKRINAFEYSKAGTALLAIILVVWALDFLSAQIRKKLV
ncbi:phosphonate ABC transporter, permease protein PhnE [uncultured Thermanaerothrix sp.]|uniref:phosphonate ABC transporter, permease protein PhnE n=1 Tax=uncultured Thermanaerothrix sp. TaxID=1195149 RepID=UPI00262A0E81|nr:phosphonate ABC transporter, permease protein PhnE [uncultured Thermanaerothrix sp.]